MSQPHPALARSAGRLKRRAEFLRVAAKGSKTATHGLVLQALNREDQGPPRIGFTVTKKIGNAVVRNRTRRRLKEAARLELACQQLNGVDLVLIGRDSTKGRSFTDLRDDFRRALRKAGVGLEGGQLVTGRTSIGAHLAIGAVRVYQLTIRPLTGAHCRFWPSCSDYAIDAVRRHGAVRGGALAARRVLRCNPWHEGGWDPVPEPDRPTGH